MFVYRSMTLAGIILSLLLRATPARADQASVIITSRIPLTMQGTGGATLPTFPGSAFTVCWGVTEVPQLDTFNSGPYFSIVSLSNTPSTLPTTSVQTTSRKDDGSVETVTKSQPQGSNETQSANGHTQTTLLSTSEPQSSSDHGCKTIQSNNDRYGLSVIAPEWTSWAITITPA